MSAIPIKITTTDRILDASLKLFNELGFNKVPAMRIARHLSISPGHLAYHFKNKSDIVLALFPRMEKAVQELLLLAMPHIAPASIDRALKELQILWSYRFFFNDLPQLLASDLKLRDSYLKLEQRILGTIEHAIEVRITEGILRPSTPPNSTHFLAKCIWTMWLDWIRVQQLKRPGQQTPDKQSLHEALLSGYLILQPYLTADFFDAVVVGLENWLREETEAAEKLAAKRRTKRVASGSKRSAS